MKKLIFTIFFLLFSVSTVLSQSWKELDSLGTEYYEKGNYKSALIYWEKGVTQAEKEFGKNDSNYATSLNNLAVLIGDMGQYDKAEPLYKKALKIDKEVFGEKHPSYAIDLCNLGILYYKMGQYEKAEPLYKEALKIRKEVFGEKHPDYARSLFSLGTLYDDMGQYDKAELYYKEALKIRKEVLGEKHFSYAVSLNNLAALYNNIGQFDKAEPLFKEASKIFKEVLGETHPYYASSLNNMAVLYEAMGQYDKALPLYKEAIKIKKEVLSDKHPDYALSLNNLALLYYKMGQYDKGEPLLKEAGKIIKEILGVKHPDYATSLNNFATLYGSMGQYDKAEPLHKEAIKIRKEVLGEKHPDYAISLNNLGILYKNMSLYDKAEPLYKEALKIRKEVLGEKHPDYATSLNNLAGLYSAIEQYDKAEPLYKEANENYLEQLKTYYPALSENEKVKFLKTIELNFESFYSFGIKRSIENTNITKNIFDLRINTKGLILSSTSNIRKRITESNDIELNEKYNKLLSLRTKIGKAYTLSLEEQKKKEINLTELEASANELEKEISLKSEDFKSEVESREIKYIDIQKALKQNETAIEFLDFKYFDKNWTDTIYYCALIIRPDLENPILISLCTLDELKKYLSGSSESNNSYVKNDEKSNGLYKLIWKPLEEYLKGIENVYISSSGILNKVSFASLKSNEQNLLIDKYQLRYVGNLKDIVGKRKEIDDVSMNTNFFAAVFGGAVYDIDSASMQQLALNYSRGADDEWKPSANMILVDDPKTRASKWNYLPGTLSEANNIKLLFEKKNLKVNEYTGVNASEEALKSLNSKKSPTVLHISTHGYFFPEPDKEYRETSKNPYKASDNPLFRSGLILSGANRVWTGGEEIEGIENGILTAYEVANMDLMNTELVVLSACETGLGDIKGGEGVYGLQRAFKVAGAKTIIMSLWKVPDKETVELMELFYTNWIGGMTKHEAFSSAQKEMRKKYPPYYWAAFVMVE